MFQLNTQQEDSRANLVLGAIGVLIILALFFGGRDALADEGNGYEKPDFDKVCNAYLKNCPTDSNSNDRVKDSVALAAAADSRIADGSADLNLDLNIMTSGGSAGFGGAIFVNLEKPLGVPVHVGPRGAIGTNGDFVVGLGASIPLKGLFD